MLALIRRFLKAGVLIEGQRFDTEDGVPQGASLSPLLANVYLHYVLDEWFEHDVKPRLEGEAHLIRYADDCGARQCAREMRVGPSQPVCGGRLQTTMSGIGLRRPGRRTLCEKART